MLRSLKRLMNLDYDRLNDNMFYNHFHRCMKSWRYEVKLITEEINPIEQFI